MASVNFMASMHHFSDSFAFDDKYALLTMSRGREITRSVKRTLSWGPTLILVLLTWIFAVIKSDQREWGTSSQAFTFPAKSKISN